MSLGKYPMFSITSFIGCDFISVYMHLYRRTVVTIISEVFQFEPVNLIHCIMKSYTIFLYILWINTSRFSRPLLIVIEADVEIIKICPGHAITKAYGLLQYSFKNSVLYGTVQFCEYHITNTYFHSLKVNN